MLGKYLKAALVFVMASMVSSQATNTIIYMDYTSGYSTVLPSGQVNAAFDALYSTNVPGSYRFGVDWNNDATDQYTVNVPAFVTVVANNNASFCSLNSSVNGPAPIIFTTTGVHTCNYTASWTTSFSGVLTVTYDGGPNTGSSVRSDAISTFFTNTTVIGDPQFVGLRGQSYQVHGIDGAVYNIISEKNTQVNSRFVFLTKGECPMINGVADSNCWSHPGSYLGELSFQQVVDGELHAALVTSGKAKKGFSMVQVDGKQLQVGDKVTFGSFSLEMTSTHKVIVNTENFEFELTNSDLFVNQQLRSKVALSKLKAHGLLGQTHSTKSHASPLKFVEGEVDDYVVADSDIFGSDFVYNQFSS